MEDDNLLEKLSVKFGQSASVKNVFGDPIHLGEKIIIPVAQIAYGLGGGYGQGSKHSPKTSHYLIPETTEESNLEVANDGTGGGGGGGLYATPKGVYEITPTHTRFVPAQTWGQLLMGVATGVLVSALLTQVMARRKKDSN